MQSQVTQRNPIVVFLLSFITCGIYSWYWLVKVKGELNRSQNSVNIPTAWVWVIPFVGTIWYEWKFGEATDIVTSGKYSAPVTFSYYSFLVQLAMQFYRTVTIRAAASSQHQQHRQQRQHQ